MTDAPYHPEAASPVEQALAERLVKEGWSQTGRALFGLTHATARLELHARVGQGNMLLVLIEDGGREEEMHIEFGDRLNDVVDAIVEHQASLSFANFLPFVTDITAICPATVGFVDRS